MDKLNQSLLIASRKDSLDWVARVHMLELIELRAVGWQPNVNVTNEYKQRLFHAENQSQPGYISKQASVPSITSSASAETWLQEDSNPVPVSRYAQPFVQTQVRQ